MIGLARRVEMLAQIDQLGLQALLRLDRGIALRLLAIDFQMDLFELALDLAAPLQRALCLLGKPHVVELQIVALLLEILGLFAQLEAFVAALLQSSCACVALARSRVGLLLQHSCLRRSSSISRWRARIPCTSESAA
jgi:hypothetical protein